MKKYTKRQIEKIIYESKGYDIYYKRNLKLKEEKNAYVTNQSSNGGSNTLSTDLTNAKADNPTDKNFVVDANSYNSNSSDDAVTINVNGNNPTDAAKNFQKTVRNPNVKRLMNTTKVNANIRLKESSVPFTKKEIKRMFKK